MLLQLLLQLLRLLFRAQLLVRLHQWQVVLPLLLVVDQQQQ